MNVWATYDEIDSSNRSSYLQQTAINTEEYLAKKQTETSEAMSIMPLIEGQGVSLLNKGVEVGMGKLKNLGLGDTADKLTELVGHIRDGNYDKALQTASDYAKQTGKKLVGDTFTDQLTGETARQGELFQQMGKLDDGQMTQLHQALSNDPKFTGSSDFTLADNDSLQSALTKVQGGTPNTATTAATDTDSTLTDLSKAASSFESKAAGLEEGLGAADLAEGGFNIVTDLATVGVGLAMLFSGLDTANHVKPVPVQAMTNPTIQLGVNQD